MTPKKGEWLEIKDERIKKDEKQETTDDMATGVKEVYALFLFVLAFFLNQLDRYILAVVNLPLSQEIGYGDKACLHNETVSTDKSIVCNATTERQCDDITVNSSQPCKWDYNGLGREYEILAGPIFIVVYTFVGIPIGFAADKYNRKNMLGIAVFFWSAMTVLMGCVKEYWQLALLRFLLGAGQAGCTPFASSLIADLFAESSRAAALGVYNLGIYIGYSMSYAFGNFITAADILGQGWRWSFYISGMPGLLLGPLICLTLKEPLRGARTKAAVVSSSHAPESDVYSNADPDPDDSESVPLVPEDTPSHSKVILQTFCKPTLLMLCLGGSIRNAGGYVWAYNTQPYYESIGQSPQTIGTYMAFIPLFAGSVGVVLGGVVADRVVKRLGPRARLVVLAASQLIAAPFVAGALFFSPPLAYYTLIPGYIVGEFWIGITLAVAVEVMPPSVRTAGVAVYMFIISNIGGNMVLLVSPLENAFMGLGYSKVQSLRFALYILYPGLYVLGAVLFLFTLCLLTRDMRAMQDRWMEGAGAGYDNSNPSSSEQEAASGGGTSEQGLKED